MYIYIHITFPFSFKISAWFLETDFRYTSIFWVFATYHVSHISCCWRAASRSRRHIQSHLHGGAAQAVTASRSRAPQPSAARAAECRAEMYPQMFETVVHSMVTQLNKLWTLCAGHAPPNTWMLKEKVFSYALSIQRFNWRVNAARRISSSRTCPSERSTTSHYGFVTRGCVTKTWSSNWIESSRCL